MFGPGGWLHKFYSEEEMKKVFLHHDKASSHTCREVEKYLSTMSKKLGFRWVRKDDIPVKGCDISPLDFWCFGKMKNALKNRRPRTLNGLWDLVRTEFKSISAEECMRVMRAWLRRLALVRDNDGNAIQHLKAIHKTLGKKQTYRST